MSLRRSPLVGDACGRCIVARLSHSRGDFLGRLVFVLGNLRHARRTRFGRGFGMRYVDTGERTRLRDGTRINRRTELIRAGNRLSRPRGPGSSSHDRGNGPLVMGRG